MATVSQWLAGARPRTLSAALAPVAAGSGVAAYEGSFRLGIALLALLVAMALQVGVNYANDYSDGIRGTDDERVGPVRLVGQKLAQPQQVKIAAFTAFGVAALAGLLLVVVSQVWWLLPVGLVSVAAGWFYTGGSRPYGYAGLGEVSVFIFFGLVATAGTSWAQVGTLTWPAIVAAIPIGLWSSAILLANNIRDIPGGHCRWKKYFGSAVGRSPSTLGLQRLPPGGFPGRSFTRASPPVGVSRFVGTAIGDSTHKSNSVRSIRS